MKKLKFLIPVIILAVLVSASALALKTRLCKGKTVGAVVESTAALTSAGTAVSMPDRTSAEQDRSARTSAEQGTGAETVTIDSIAVNPQKLIDNLDKTTDDTIDYIYKQSPENIKIGNIYEGSFSGSSKPELLVIFKLFDMPHAGGLDCSVAALYERYSYALVSQKTFPYDECRFTVLKDSKQKSCLLFVGSTTYQGRSQYILQLYKPGRAWEKLYSAEPPVISELLDDPNNIKFELRDDGRVWVYRPVSYDSVEQQFKWRHVYDLVWNKETCTLDEAVPKTLKNTDGSRNAEAVSVSPDGRYALSTIPEKFKVLLYNTEKNTLAAEFEMLGQDYGFLWSPDSGKVCASRTARVWIESSIIDTSTLKSVDITAQKLQDTFRSNIKLGYQLNENRPDPYITPVEWSPDGRSILMFYQWTDTKYDRQSGTFVYDTVSDHISRITRNKPETEGGNLPAIKPKGFKW